MGGLACGALHGLLYRGLPAGVGTESERPSCLFLLLAGPFHRHAFVALDWRLSNLWELAPAKAKQGNLLAIVSSPLIAILYVANFARGLGRFGIWNSCRCAWNNRFASRFGPRLSGASHTVQGGQAPETSVYDQQRRFRAAFVDSSTSKGDGEDDFGQLRPSF